MLENTPANEPVQPIIHDTTPAKIEEPPMKNRKSCLWRSCSGLFFLLILLVGFFIVITAFWGAPTPKRVASLPSNFPSDVPLYRFPDRLSVTYLPGNIKDSIIQRLALLPKYIFGPIILKINPNLPDEQTKLNNETIIPQKISWAGWQKIWSMPLGTPDTDTIEVTWEELDDSPAKVASFYKKNFQQQDYRLEPGMTAPELQTLVFEKDKVRAELTIQAKGEDRKQTVAQIWLKVKFPATAKKQ